MMERRSSLRLLNFRRLSSRDTDTTNDANRTQGYLTKHKRIKEPWRRVQQLDENYKKRWFLLQDGILFYFTEKRHCDDALRTQVPLSKVARGFILLHNVEVFESENISKKNFSFVLQFVEQTKNADSMTSPRENHECMLLYASSEAEKADWISSIQLWQSSNMSKIQSYDFFTYNEECELCWNASGIPYYFNRFTQESSWNQPVSNIIPEKEISQRFSKGSFIVWVRVVKGKDIKINDANKSNTPYCKIIYKNLQYKTTKSVLKENECEWSPDSRRFEYLLSLSELLSKEDLSLQVELFDRTIVDTPNRLSSAKIPINSFWEAFGHKTEVRVNLMTSEDRIQGELYLEVQMNLATMVSSEIDRLQLSTSLYRSQFGVSLTSISEDTRGLRNSIPRIVYEACDIVRRKGLHEQGIFRLSGSKSSIYRLRVFCNLNWEYDLESEDVNSVAGLLKLFLRESTEPLFPFNIYSKVVSIASNNTIDELNQCAQLKGLIFGQDIPLIHQRTMQCIFKLMFDIASNAEHNLMHSKNLAVVLAPNIMRPPPHLDHVTLSDMNHVQNATDLLIRYYRYVFENA